MLRKWLLVLMVVVGLAAIGSLFARRGRFHPQVLKSCFTDVQGLKPGSSVRIAGVDVGTVTSVRPNPQNNNCPAEVEMELATAYDLRIPRDSLTEIDTDGLLGGSLVTIDVRQASGSPIENYGYLKSKPTPRALSLEEKLTAARILLELNAARRSSEKSSSDRVSTPAPHSRP
jgi:ABC-type transporter Mla subunit MlaD